jgi:hypothetical protein
MSADEVARSNKSKLLEFCAPVLTTHAPNAASIAAGSVQNSTLLHRECGTPANDAKRSSHRLHDLREVPENGPVQNPLALAVYELLLVDIEYAAPKGKHPGFVAETSDGPTIKLC